MEYCHRRDCGACGAPGCCTARRSADWISGVRRAVRVYGATYHVGSLIYVKDVDYTQLEVGDPITFMLDEDTVATHRIVEVVPDETDSSVLRFRTKGDANDAVDGSLVHYKNVIGTPVFTIPKLGYLADYIQNPPGIYIAISAGAVLVLLMFLPDLFSKDEKKQTENKGRHLEEKE